MQLGARVAMRGAGDFVVVWADGGQDGDGYGVFGRRFDSSGTALAAEFQVNTYVTDNQGGANPFMSEDGKFVVAWVSTGQDGDGNGVFARRFASDGSPIGLEFQVNAYTIGAQGGPSVVQTDDEVIFVWHSDGQDGSAFGVFGGGRGFEEEGLPEDVQLNVYTNGDQVGPVLRLIGGGDRTPALVVVWSSEFQDGDFYGVFGRSIDQHDQFSEDDFLVNTTTLFNQRNPRIASAGERFVVVWQSQHDGSAFGIFGRRFVMPLTLDVDGDGEIQPLTDGLLVLRYEFGFRGATLITGVVGSSCTRCDAPTIEEYLGSV
jgi:hypothetical protein